MVNKMAKKEEKINFDLSVLSLTELIETYNDIEEFLAFLKDNKIEIEEKEGVEDEE